MAQRDKQIEEGVDVACSLAAHALKQRRAAQAANE